jgi:hypothetical protein
MTHTRTPTVSQIIVHISKGAPGSHDADDDTVYFPALHVWVNRDTYSITGRNGTSRRPGWINRARLRLALWYWSRTL